MFVFLTFGTLALMLQILNPELFLVSPLEVLVTITMYFTIENPDIKLLKEMHDAKVISDNANEEKTMFLYNMTQEIRKTTKNINVEADNILESKDLELDKDIIPVLKENMLKEASQAGERIIASDKKQAEDEAAKILEHAKLEIQAERESAMRDICSQVSMLSLKVAEKVVRKSLDKDEEQVSLVERLISEAENTQMHN